MFMHNNAKFVNFIVVPGSKEIAAFVNIVHTFCSWGEQECKTEERFLYFVIKEYVKSFYIFMLLTRKKKPSF